MSWLEKIKNKLGFWMLEKKVEVRKGINPIPSFESIQEIGVIYNATKAIEEEQMNRIAHFLRNQGKKVWTLGYVDSNKLPHNRKFHISSEYFWKEQLNFLNLPQPEKVGQFMNHNFDLLMNLYFDPILPMQAMSCICQAKYRMGAQIENGIQYNDSIIDTGNDHSIQSLSAQIVHYLKVINQHESNK